MTRNTAREIAIQLIYGADIADSSYKAFAEDFLSEEHFSTLGVDCELYSKYPDDNQLDYILNVVSLIDEYKVQIDAYISKYSRAWKLNRISGTALAVLRCALCEILYIEDIPNAAAVNSAIEISKKYDEQETTAYINGVLGSVIRCEVENKDIK